MTAIIITISILLIIAYVFDISSSKTKIPSVILLLILGWAVKQLSIYFSISIPDLNSILPLLGTIGLILIVLEGSLELEFNKSKFSLIRKSAIISLLSMLILSCGLGFLFHYISNVTFKIGVANAIPYSIISSAIAIPSAQHLLSKNKEFITYESSLSDIFGVIFFNFITLNAYIGSDSFGHFFLQVFTILIVSFVATLCLAWLLSKLNHTVKFTPIILMIVLIYTISKVYHLPALIFILLFGIFIGNIDEFESNKFIQKLKPEILTKEVKKFKELVTEMAFLVRSLFFLLFGYLIETSEILNTETIYWAIGITFSIFLLRYLILKLFKLPASPLLFIAPRGLITILLFLSIPFNQTMYLSNNSLVIQVIIFTAIIMMFGLLTNNKDINKVEFKMKKQKPV